MSNPKKKKTVLIIVLIVIAFFLFVLPRCSKAESEGVITAVPLETPNPSASWEDYLNEHPLVTTPPYEYETPEPSPTPAPPLIMGTNPYTTARFTAYRFAPEVEDGEVTYYYQKLIPNYNLYTSYQGNYSTVATQNNGWYIWNAAAVPNGHFQINEQCGLINLVDTYICAWWNIYYSSSQALNSGLDYGTEATVFVKWPLDVLDYRTQQLVSSIPVTAVVYVWLDNGEWVTLDPVIIGSNDLSRGYTFKIRSDYENRKIYRISTYFYIGLSYDAYQNLGVTENRDAARTYLVKNNYLEQPFECHAYVNKNPGWAVGEKILSFIKTIPNSIINGISGIFVPSQEDITAWVNQHVNDEMESGNPVNRYWQVYLSIMQKFVNPSYNSDPTLQVPSWSFNISGTKYTVFNGYNWRIKDADVPLGDGTTLFYWTKLAFSILLVIGVIMRFIYAIWTRIYDVHYSAENQTKDG